MGWEPCGTCSGDRASFGHQTIRCGLRECGWRYYYPAHEGLDWIEA
jgi:hypothetical protein